MDKRQFNGGRRAGAGRKKKVEDEKVTALTYYLKLKHHPKAKRKIDPIVEKINNEP